jgi:hypothetical protein
MFDTINLWLPIDDAGIHNFDKSIKSLNQINECINDDGQVSIHGNLNNYKVKLSGKGVSLKGSLAKYYLPDNFHTLTRSDTARAIEKLSDEINLPIHLAKVSRIDFAQNLIMNYEPQAYYSFLGECQYYKRQKWENSLYYKNENRTKLFYNKIKEGKSKGLKLPDVWNGQNVLRYEMRFTKRIKKQFNQLEINASNLSDEKFYMKIFDKWMDEYTAINKINNLKFDLSKMKSPKDYLNNLLLRQILIDGQDKIMQEIEDLRHLKTFEKPEYYSRLKKQIKQLCKSQLTASSELIFELDKKIKATKNNYR